MKHTDNVLASVLLVTSVGTICNGLPVVNGTVFLETKYRFSINVVPLVLCLARVNPCWVTNAVTLRLTGGITLVVTAVVTGVQSREVNSFIENVQVVPPTGLFKLMYTTLLSNILRRTVPAAFTSLRKRASVLSTLVIGPLIMQTTIRLANRSVSNGTTKTGPSVLRSRGKCVQ